MRVERPWQPDDDQDVIDHDDWLNQGVVRPRRIRSSGGPDRAAPMRQVLGPSCLFTMIIILIIVVVAHRFMALPLTSLFCLTVFVWGTVFGLLLRIQPKDGGNDEQI